MGSNSKYSPEFRAEAVRLVKDSGRPVAQIAKELGVIPETLRNWVKSDQESSASEGEPLSLEDRARLKELERINRQQAMEIEFLKKAAAYFAKDRP